jgi:arginase
MNRKLNLYVPQWQGSGPTDELYHGAAALKEYARLQGVSFSGISLIPGGELRVENDILGYAQISAQLEEIKGLLLTTGPEKIFTVGGGCGIEIPLVSRLRELHGPLDVIWFDAHGDLNSPESSPSKYFHGMPLRFLLEDLKGNGISESFGRISPEELTMAGIRDLDPPEEEFIREKRIKVVPVREINRLTDFLNAGHTKAYLHIDLDVLDPGEYRNVKCPARDGLRIGELAECIRRIAGVREIVGMSLLENTERDLQRIRAIDPLVQLGIAL